MSTTVFCQATTQAKATQIVTQLREAGFTDPQISVLLPDKSANLAAALERHLNPAEGESPVSLFTGAIGHLKGIGPVDLGAAGGFIASGPLRAALGPKAGVAEVLSTLGLPEVTAKAFESRLHGSHLLIAAHCADEARETLARSLFKDNGGDEITVGLEQTATAKAPKAHRSADEPAPPPPIEAASMSWD